MYVARMTRPDLLRSIAYLSRCLAKWSEEQAKRLQRFRACINNSLGYRMCAWNDAPNSGDPFMLVVFSDADYAGCAQTQRSATGAVVFLTRKGARTPISFLPKHQRCVSTSTSVTEIVAMGL